MDARNDLEAEQARRRVARAGMARAAAPAPAPAPQRRQRQQDPFLIDLQQMLADPEADTAIFVQPEAGMVIVRIQREPTQIQTAGCWDTCQLVGRR